MSVTRSITIPNITYPHAGCWKRRRVELGVVGLARVKGKALKYNEYPDE